MKNLISVKSIAIMAAAILSVGSAKYSSAQDAKAKELNIAGYMNSNRILNLAVSSLNSRGEGLDAMGEAGGIKSIDIDDTPERPYTVSIATKNNCLITVVLKQKPLETKDLQQFDIASKSIVCEEQK